MFIVLIKDRWVILAEDYALTYGSDRLYADIAAEKAIVGRSCHRCKIKLAFLNNEAYDSSYP